MDRSQLVALSALVFVFAVLAIVWDYRRARSGIERWAVENGLTLVLAETRTFAQGPFTWSAYEGDVVYYVVAREGSGRERRGFVRLRANWLCGFEISVLWD